VRAVRQAQVPVARAVPAVPLVAVPVAADGVLAARRQQARRTPSSISRRKRLTRLQARG